MSRDEVGAARACLELARICPPIRECMSRDANIWASQEDDMTFDQYLTHPESIGEPSLDPPSMESAQDPLEEQEREQRWSYLIGELRYFMDKEGGGAKGIAACLRAVGEAVTSQPGLFR